MQNREDVCRCSKTAIIQIIGSLKSSCQLLMLTPNQNPKPNKTFTEQFKDFNFLIISITNVKGFGLDLSTNIHLFLNPLHSTFILTHFKKRQRIHFPSALSPSATLSLTTAYQSITRPPSVLEHEPGSHLLLWYVTLHTNTQCFRPLVSQRPLISVKTTHDNTHTKDFYILSCLILSS